MVKKPSYEELEQRVKELEKAALERKKAEEPLQEFEKEKEIILKSLVEHVIYQDTEMRILWANRAACESVNLTREQLLGRFCYEIWPQRNDPCPDCPLRKAMKTGQSEEIEKYTPDGRVWFIRGYPVQDANGKIVGAIELTLDITERKQAEEELRNAHHKLAQQVKERTAELVEANEELKQFFKTVTDAIMLFDAETRQFIDVNEAALSLYGYSREEFLKLRHQNITAEPENSDVSIRQTLEGKLVRIPVRYHKKKDRTIFPVEISTSMFTLRNRKVLCGVIRDITERKRAEDALRDSEARLEALSEAFFEAIFLSEKGVCLDQNKTAERIFGYTSAETVGRHGTEWIVPEDREQVNNNMLSGYEKPYEVTALLKDGTTFPCEIQARMTDYQGRSIRITALRDITECKRAEEELRKAHDKLEMKVVERTAELVMANDMLEQEIEERKQIELALTERRKDLENKTHELGELNAALRVLLKHRDEDKKDLEDKVVANVKELVFPYVEKLNNSRLNDRQMVYLNIIKSNLEDIITPFLHQLSSKYSDLTPNEIQVAGFVKEGKTTKEIAELLNSSTGAINFHRNNLRKKLGLRNTKTNLMSFLLSLA